MKTINIVREQNIKVLKDYTDKLDIDFIYVPFEKEDNIKVKLQESVLKGQLLYEDNNTKRYSSISGTVVKIDKHLIIIKNNYKELTTNTRARKLDDLSLESFEKYYVANSLLGYHITEKERIVISNIVHLAKDLNMEIVAEGVETEEQNIFLREIDCPIIQGFVFSKPIPQEEFMRKYFL